MVAFYQSKADPGKVEIHKISLCPKLLVYAFPILNICLILRGNYSENIFTDPALSKGTVTNFLPQERTGGICSYK